MRLSAYCAWNVPITWGMLLSKPTPANIVFWQWLNQTYFFGVNYANRSASSKFTQKDLAFAYVSSVCASIGVGLGVKKLLAPMEHKFRGSRAFFFTFLIAFLANSSANATNLLCVRRKELTEGIPVQSEGG